MNSLSLCCHATVTKPMYSCDVSTPQLNGSNDDSHTIKRRRCFSVTWGETFWVKKQLNMFQIWCESPICHTKMNINDWARLPTQSHTLFYATVSIVYKYIYKCIMYHTCETTPHRNTPKFDGFSCLCDVVCAIWQAFLVNVGASNRFIHVLSIY